jgi:hypothetical protein
MYPWKFIADVAGDHAELLGYSDNRILEEHLKQLKAYDEPGSKPDSEYCCFYTYFTCHDAGVAFLQGLNEYLKQKNCLLEEAKSY